jgi:hypothetical protein
MRRRSLPIVFVLTLTAGLIASLTSPASADHTTPPGPLAANTETTQTGVQVPLEVPPRWQHITNWPANPGSDLALFRRQVGATREIYASMGTLGGGDEQHVGQRIVRLTSNGGNVLDPTWVADHGSANCPGTGSTGNLGLQHDAAAVGMARRTSASQSITGVQPVQIQLIADATDASGRCHDSGGGGLELIDVTNPAFPKEIGLTRHAGTTHTTTTDDMRPWIVYSSNSDFSGRPWIDVVDTRTCLNLGTRTIAEKRALCRPQVYRIPFQPEWTYQRNYYNGGGAIDPTFGSAACHDITSVGTRLYCAAIRATLVLDVANLTDENGNIRGTQMPCPVVAGTSTTAMVVNCAGQGAGAPTVAADAFEFLGTINHAGIDCTAPPAPRNTSCNSNNLRRSDQDVSISHESDPNSDARVMFVTDERGGGVVPGGATCFPVENPFGNGGMHAIDIRGATPGRLPADNFPYWKLPNGDPAVFIGTPITPSPTFCDIHMIEHAEGEQRIFAAWYTQGVKVIDYFFHDNGPGPEDDRISFVERAHFQLPNANTWMVMPFRIFNNPDGTRTYWLVGGDINRGHDVMIYRDQPNPIGTPPPPTVQAAGFDPFGLLLLGVAVLPTAAVLRRRRRSRA